MKIYNTLSQKKENFVPLHKDKILMYVCGITPYDTTHLGHAFVYNFFDVFKRYLEYKNYHVIYTQNVTDIDDDILLRAKRDNEDWKELGNFWTEKFLNDCKRLNILKPDFYVKATDSIDRIIKITKVLLEKNHAYEVDGTVFFSVDSFSEYGKLSRLSTSEMITLSLERGANPNDTRKKNPLDFILWQKSLPEQPFWDSPFGKGRPGWHIECSSMVYDTLGSQIDVHGGGFDLIYPHHESEIAQSESYTDKKPFVTYWMHVGMLSYKGEKMSKSLGNLVLISDLLKTYSPAAIRWLLLSHHYRDAWEYTEKEAKRAEQELENLQITNLKPTNKDSSKIMKQFETYMENDFNTPEVLKLIISASKDTDNQQVIINMLSILGIT